MRRAAAALTVGMLVWLSAAAPSYGAPPAPPDDQKKTLARSKLVEGDTALKEGNYQQALAMFREAFDLYPSPKIQYNFGLAYKGMGRNADAIQAFETFLREVPDAQAEVRSNAERNREALLTTIGVLKVTAEVAGASIMVDGREVGQTPHAADIRLDPGPHLLLVSRGAGTLPFTQRLELAAGGAVSVTVTFPPAATDPGGGGSTSALGYPQPTTEAPRPRWVLRAAWATAGLALASAIVGGVGWTIKEGKYSSFNDHTPTCDKAFVNDGGDDCHSLREAGDSAKMAGIAGFVSAGVFGAASAALFLWSPRLSQRWSQRLSQRTEEGPTSTSTRLSLGCAPNPAGALGAICSVAF